MRSSLTIRPRAAGLMVALASLALAAAGCGEDPPAKKPARPKPGAKTGKSTAKAKRGKGGRLEVYTKAPDELRHVFSERDFKPDPTGDENRDPFQSYVVRLAGNRKNTRAPELKIDVTELCTKDNSVATNYSLRDLRLIGIVLRGTRSWAVFTDRKQFGHFVHKGDCLGKEKARVEAIGAGFVRLEVIAEAPPGAVAPPAQKRDIQLHPEEFLLEEEEAPAEAPPGPAATPGAPG